VLLGAFSSPVRATVASLAVSPAVRAVPDRAAPRSAPRAAPFTPPIFLPSLAPTAPEATSGTMLGASSATFCGSWERLHFAGFHEPLVTSAGT
jgi:hypothetical protein